jgi:hypothetical protein
MAAAPESDSRPASSPALVLAVVPVSFMPSRSMTSRPLLLATSLYEDPAAELHEDASARLREHLPFPGCRPCAVARPASGVSGCQEPAGGHEKGAVANHGERPALGTLRCGSAAR